MKYASILAAFHSTPWAILPAKLEEIRAFLALKCQGEDLDPDDVARVVAARRGPGNSTVVGKVAVLPVFGVLSQRVGMVEQASGGISTEAVGAALDQLAGDSSVRSIVLAFDSPGGSVYGVQELADRIREVGSQKKVVGLADSVAASAAYWLLSQTSEINVTPGGQVGSIGVIAAHEDVSKAEELAGSKTTLVTSSPYKAEGNPFGPLSDEARAELQAKVDHYHAQFVKAVARGRGVTEAKVNADFGQGRMATAKDAVARGMADRVATLDQVLGRLGASGGGAGLSPQARARHLRVIRTREDGH